MGFYFSKSKFVSACVRCNKYAWLDKYMPERKAPVDEYTQSLFDNGHKVGALAQECFHADVDVTTTDENGRLNMAEMLRKTQAHIDLATPVISEASFSFGGFFCSVDILVRNPDGSYDLCEVKSSKPMKPTKRQPLRVHEKYILDAAYQRYVLERCGIKLGKVYVVMLSRDYVRGEKLELDKYFVKCDVTADTAARQGFVADKLAELDPILNNPAEPKSMVCKGCKGCDYFGCCYAKLPSPSVFDIYDLDFAEKCRLYDAGVAFEDVPETGIDLEKVAQLQIAYHDRPLDAHIDKGIIQTFLDSLRYPLYSLDFETYQAVVPEHPGMRTSEAIPFQYSLHKIAKADPDIRKGSSDLEESHFLDLSGGDPRRAIAESLVQNIPWGACIVAYHASTESGIVEGLAKQFGDLADHLRSFTYRDPLEVFKKGGYYVPAMGASLSLKSVSPALYPDDPDMNYKNLEGDIKNGTQAMNAIWKVKELSEEALAKLQKDLENYCALDTLAVVKILKKLYEVTK